MSSHSSPLTAQTSPLTARFSLRPPTSDLRILCVLLLKICEEIKRQQYRGIARAGGDAFKMSASSALRLGPESSTLPPPGRPISSESVADIADTFSAPDSTPVPLNYFRDYGLHLSRVWVS
jgi:hypothetical protein